MFAVKWENKIEKKRKNSKFKALWTTTIVSEWIADCSIEHHFSLLECLIKTNGMPDKVFAWRANDIMFSMLRFTGNTTTFDEESIVRFAVFVWKSDFHFHEVRESIRSDFHFHEGVKNCNQYDFWILQTLIISQLWPSFSIKRHLEGSTIKNVIFSCVSCGNLKNHDNTVLGYKRGQNL